MNNPNLIACPHCQKELSVQAEVCPHCGNRNVPGARQSTLLALLVYALLLVGGVEFLGWFIWKDSSGLPIGFICVGILVALFVRARFF